MAKAIFYGSRIYENPGDYQAFNQVQATQEVVPSPASPGILPALLQAASQGVAGAMSQRQGPTNITPQQAAPQGQQNFGAMNPIYLQLMQLAQQFGKGIPLNQPQVRR